MALTIIKTSGVQELFNRDKLASSLVRSGAPHDVAEEIARKVELEIGPSARTKHIFRLARRLLKQYSRASGMRYSIKKALSSLGPSGYPFEHYVAGILRTYGYSTEVNRVMTGFCVTHEVDVFAVKDNEHCIIECKYHSDDGKPTDVKIALYIHSRFEDIKKAQQLSPDSSTKQYEGWLVTNTRCSSDAVRYAECTGLRIVSWRYPEKNSLEKLIEGKRLYPVNILPSAKKEVIDALLRNNLILAKDISEMDAEDLSIKSGIDKKIIALLKKEADELCRCP
jgi:hypothetical protein